MPEITEAQREMIAAVVEECSDARKRLDDLSTPLRSLLAPYEEMERIIDGVEAHILDAHDVEIAGTCQHCGRLMFCGEMGYRFDIEDNGIVYCEAHGITYGDLQEHWASTPADVDSEEEAEARECAREMTRHHIESGGSLADRVPPEIL